MDTEDLKIFLSVAEHLSFSVAAEHVHLTQPAVSKRIANLENELDVKLFDRIARKISLTEAGKIFQSRARTLIHELEVMQSAMRTLQKGPSGSLALAISHHLGLHRFPPLLQEYASRYPDVILDVRFVDSERAYDAIIQGNVDIAVITLAPEPQANVKAHPLWDDPLYYVCSKNHPLAGLDGPELHDLSRYGCLLPSLATYTGRIIKQQFDNHRLALKPVMTTNYLETLAKMTEIGLGWSVLPATLLADNLTVLKIESPLQRQLGVIHHRQRTLSRAAEALLDILQSKSS